MRRGKSKILDFPVFNPGRPVTELIGPVALDGSKVDLDAWLILNATFPVDAPARKLESCWADQIP